MDRDGQSRRGVIEQDPKPKAMVTSAHLNTSYDFYLKVFLVSHLGS